MRIRNLFALDPGPGMEKFGSGINIPRSATLVSRVRILSKLGWVDPDHVTQISNSGIQGPGSIGTSGATYNV
jgi:hypothetical protein